METQIWRVPLPEAIGEPLEVYVNGIPQRPGTDYELLGRDMIFRRELAQEGRLGKLRWASMFLGVAGTYRQNDSVDVVYEAGGRRTVVSGLKFYPT